VIQAIKELGEYKLKKEGKDTSGDILSTLVQDPNQTGRYPFVFVIVFSLREGNKVSYSHISLEGTDKEKSMKYLYRRASSQGPNYTPTCITGENFQKTLKNRIEGWFKKIKKSKKGQVIFELKTEEKKVEVPLAPIFENLLEAFRENKTKIFKDLTQKWEEVRAYLKEKGGTGMVLTIGFSDTDGNIKYMGDFPEFCNFLLNCKVFKLRGIYKEKHSCSICHKFTEVYGNAIADIFKFYTLDKPGYIAGGFEKLNAWKNFPLCFDCALKIEEGKDFLESYLQFSMGKNNYYLIPKFIFGIEEAKDVINEFFIVVTRSKDTLKEIKHISEDEKEILEKLGECEDVLTYNFMFFERQKGSSTIHRINLLVEDVLPSRLSSIFEAKRKAEEPEIFKNVKISKNKRENIEFRFDVFRGFVSNCDFLEVVDKTFRGVTFTRSLLFSWFIKSIRDSFIKEQYLKPVVLRAFVCLNFFEKLQILEKNNLPIKRGVIMTELKNKAEGFFQKFPEAFYSPASKAVFLLGVLAQKLLDIQYHERGATPFRKNLKSLTMKETDFRTLLPKIQNKLEEYKKNYYRSLESLISAYFLEAGKNWKIATDELNFYFVLGMNLKEEVDVALNLIKEERQNDQEPKMDS